MLETDANDFLGEENLVLRILSERVQNMFYIRNDMCN